MHLSSMCASVFPLEYQEAGGDMLALSQVSSPTVITSSPPVLIGVAEDEVERRLQIARDSASAEADERMRIECERISKGAREKIAQILKDFEEERAEYFRR